MLTVACVWVRGNVPYDVEDVVRLEAMVRRHLRTPYQFVCLTDQPWLLPTGMRSIPIPSPSPQFGWWAKLRLFDPALGVGATGTVLYLDLDSLIVGHLDALLDDQAPFVTVPDGGSSFQPKNGMRVIKRFNSSVMRFEAGRYADLWTDWSPEVARRLWGDQDWLAEQHPEMATFPGGWFPRLSTIGASGQVPAGAKVILAKKPKPKQAAAQWPWVREIWRAA